jgi:hypothetical protein
MQSQGLKCPFTHNYLFQNYVFILYEILKFQDILFTFDFFIYANLYMIEKFIIKLYTFQLRIWAQVVNLIFTKSELFIVDIIQKDLNLYHILYIIGLILKYKYNLL